MATIQLQPPPPFNFKTPDDWPQWRRGFEQFRVSSGLGEQPAAKQISTWVYCLGEEAESVLTPTNATEEERQVYSTVMGRFDAFFQVSRNVIFEMARFNCRNQARPQSSTSWLYIPLQPTVTTAHWNSRHVTLGAPTTGPRPDVGKSKEGHTSARSCT